MSDEFKYIGSEQMTLESYPCGICAGDILRLKDDLHLLDHNNNPTGEVYLAGEESVVLFGNPEEPNIIWLRRPNGDYHTWDETILETFESTGLRDPEFRN